MKLQVWKITTADGDVWFDDHSVSKEEAEKAAITTFGEGTVVEFYTTVNTDDCEFEVVNL